VLISTLEYYYVGYIGQAINKNKKLNGYIVKRKERKTRKQGINEEKTSAEGTAQTAK
jgi:hypothetical protein